MEDERISGAVDDQLIDAVRAGQSEQAVLETLSSAIAEEIERRKQIMGDSYPFHALGGSLAHRRSQSGVYEFCLAAARNPRGTAEGKPHVNTIFEWIARDVLASHMGPGAQAFRTGWPVHESEERNLNQRDL